MAVNPCRNASAFQFAVNGDHQPFTVFRAVRKEDVSEATGPMIDPPNAGHVPPSLYFGGVKGGTYCGCAALPVSFSINSSPKSVGDTNISFRISTAPPFSICSHAVLISPYE